MKEQYRDIRTKNRAVKISAFFHTNTSASVYVAACSLFDPSLVYFDREIIVGEGTPVFTFSIPVSPEFLRFEWQVTSGQVDDVSIVTAFSKRAKGKLQRFLEKAATDNRSETFRSGKIRIEKQEKLPGTPARVNLLDGTIELDRQSWEKLPVANRIFRLLHEYAHYYLKKKGEEEADSAAGAIFRSWGFPNYVAIEEMEDLPTADRNQRINNLAR